MPALLHVSLVRDLIEVDFFLRCKTCKIEPPVHQGELGKVDGHSNRSRGHDFEDKHDREDDFHHKKSHIRHIKQNR